MSLRLPLQLSFSTLLFLQLSIAPEASLRSQDGPLAVVDCEIFEGFAGRWERAARQLGVPGYAIAIVLDGELYAGASGGVRAPEGDPVDLDTMFYVASCTKTFTAAALVRLAESGRVDLDRPVADYLPRFELDGAISNDPITVRDLLCHRPGIQSFPIVFLDAYTGQITDERYYHWLSQVQPTGQVQYTNVHFTLAGRVVEAVAGRPWKDALAEIVFGPAGMSRTTAYASRLYGDRNVAVPMELAELAARDSGRLFVASSVRKSDRTMHAAGGVGTSARDAARWLLIQLRDGELDGKRVLSGVSTREMRSRQSDREPSGAIRRLDGFGLGWMLGTYRGRPYVTHGGGYIGTAAHFSFLPEEGIGIVVLANASPSGQALCDVVSIDIYDRLLGEDGHEDLLPDYIERVAGQRAAPGAAARVALSGDELSLEPRAYAGRYADPHWGDLTLVAKDGELSARIGDLQLRLVSVGEDRFRASSRGSGEFDGRFVVESGAVVRVSLKSGPYAPEFVRVL